MNEIKILGYGNVKEISNSEKDILIFFNINKQIIGLNYVLYEKENVYKLKNDFLINFPIQNISKTDLLNFNLIDLNLKNNKELTKSKQLKIEKINLNEYLLTSTAKDNFKNKFKLIKNNFVNESEILNDLLKLKEKLFLIDYINLDNKTIKRRNLKLKDLYEQYEYDPIKVCSVLGIRVYYSDIEISKINIDNDFIINIILSSYINKEDINAYLTYFLYYLIEINTLAESLISNLTDIEFFDKIENSISYLLPKYKIQYYMDQMIITDFNQLSKILKVRKNLLIFRLNKLGYGNK